MISRQNPFHIQPKITFPQTTLKSAKKLTKPGKITGTQYHQQTNSKTSKTKIQKWHAPPNLNRVQNKSITRIRIGHTFLTHPYLISNESQPMRDLCMTALTVKHITEKCTKYNVTRMDINIKESLEEEHTMKIKSTS